MADDTRTPGWRYALGRTAREFGRDACGDLAAGLTYRAVLAVFPALIALTSLLSLFGLGRPAVLTVTSILERVVPASSLAVIQPVLEGLTGSHGAGLALALSFVVAVVFVGGFVGATGRALNRIYGIPEGRPGWKLQPVKIGVTLLLGVLGLAGVLLILVSGPLARDLGDVLGLGPTAVLAASLLKWPALLVLFGLGVDVLYHVTPNVRRPRFRWLSPGAVLALLTWLVGSLLFGLYSALVPSYHLTYGSLAGIIVFLVWLWVSNMALLLGAELDGELERLRELRAGLPAEATVQLPLRDRRGSDKAVAQHGQDLALAVGLRKRAVEVDEGADADQGDRADEGGRTQGGATRPPS